MESRENSNITLFIVPLAVRAGDSGQAAGLPPWRTPSANRWLNGEPATTTLVRHSANGWQICKKKTSARGQCSAAAAAAANCQTDCAWGSEHPREPYVTAAPVVRLSEFVPKEANPQPPPPPPPPKLVQYTKLAKGGAFHLLCAINVGDFGGFEQPPETMLLFTHLWVKILFSSRLWWCCVLSGWMLAGSGRWLSMSLVKFNNIDR